MTQEKVAFAGGQAKNRRGRECRLKRLSERRVSCDAERRHDRVVGETRLRGYCTNALPVTCGTVTVRVRSGGCDGDRVRSQRFAGELKLHVGDAAGGDRHVGGHGVDVVHERRSAARRCDTRAYCVALPPESVKRSRWLSPVAIARRRACEQSSATRRAKPWAPTSAIVVVRVAGDRHQADDADDERDGDQLKKRHGTACRSAPCHDRIRLP